MAKGSFFPTIDIRQTGMEKISRFANNIDAESRRVRVSAMKSLGYTLSRGLKGWIKSQKTGWEQPGKIVQKYRSRSKGSDKSKWIRRRRFRGVLVWLAKYSRYRVNREGTHLDVDFGRTRRGEPGRPDPSLVRIVREQQEGFTIDITPKMRRYFGAQRLFSRRKKNRAGIDFFPIPKSKKKFKVPPRQIFDPYFRLVGPKINILLKRKIDRSYKRISAELNR